MIALELEETVPGSSSSASSSSVHSAVARDTTDLATYVPESGPMDNPATYTLPTRTLPQSPTCTVRGQTVFEIRKMRADAKQIGLSIMYEIQVMEKRKAYIEQMTQYLNDRIRELNKVKFDLAAEQKWISISNARISELALCYYNYSLFIIHYYPSLSIIHYSSLFIVI